MGYQVYQGRDTKSDRFYAKNQHTQSKLVCFENRHTTELSKIRHHLKKYKEFKLKIEVMNKIKSITKMFTYISCKSK